MTDDDTDDDVLWITCADCGEEYPVGNAEHEPRMEQPHHHADDCPVGQALEARDSPDEHPWAEPEVDEP